MKKYIEISGIGKIVESATELRATLTLTVKASKSEIALDEAGKLRDDVIRALKDAGMRDEELGEGGRDTWQPWYRKKSVGQEASYRVLVASRDAQRLYRAIDALQPLFESSRYTLGVDMLQPQFEALADAEATAQVEAIGHARAKAQILASAAGVALGAVTQVEELGSHMERSGAYGDHALAMAAGSAASLGEDPSSSFEELEGAKRARTLRYRVRFLVD